MDGDVRSITYVVHGWLVGEEDDGHDHPLFDFRPRHHRYRTILTYKQINLSYIVILLYSV